jgi:hypothetical protein
MAPERMHRTLTSNKGLSRDSNLSLTSLKRIAQCLYSVSWLEEGGEGAPTPGQLTVP